MFFVHYQARKGGYQVTDQPTPPIQVDKPVTLSLGARLFGVGLCLYLSLMFFFITVLLIVHEAIRVESGKGDSWSNAVHIIMVGPLEVATGIVGALAIWSMRRKGDD